MASKSPLMAWVSSDLVRRLTRADQLAPACGGIDGPGGLLGGALMPAPRCRRCRTSSARAWSRRSVVRRTRSATPARASSKLTPSFSTASRTAQMSSSWRSIARPGRRRAPRGSPGVQGDAEGVLQLGQPAVLDQWAGPSRDRRRGWRCGRRALAVGRCVAHGGHATGTSSMCTTSVWKIFVAAPRPDPRATGRRVVESRRSTVEEHAARNHNQQACSRRRSTGGDGGQRTTRPRGDESPRGLRCTSRATLPGAPPVLHEHSPTMRNPARARTFVMDDVTASRG